jgi:hypothetical protein
MLVNTTGAIIWVIRFQEGIENDMYIKLIQKRREDFKT